MKITQLRNATLIIELDQHVILVDPMLAPKGAIPALKYATRSRRRNPLVALPDKAAGLLSRVTACLITHCQKGHFDHLDRAGIRWLREHAIPIYCAASDADYLQKKGLRVEGLLMQAPNAILDANISLIPCQHGHGLVGKLMAHGVGFFIERPGEPTLYLAGDTVLSPEVRAFVHAKQPDISVIPAGGARFDLGRELIMDQEQALAFARIARGAVVANHLEALDHCPVSRRALREGAAECGFGTRFMVPEDGETMQFRL